MAQRINKNGLPRNFNQAINLDDLKFQVGEFAARLEDYLNTRSDTLVVNNTVPGTRLPTFKFGDCKLQFDSNGVATLQFWNGRVFISLDIGSLSGSVNLITQGTGSGTNPTLFLRSDGAGGWVLDSVASFVLQPAFDDVNALVKNHLDGRKLVRLRVSDDLPFPTTTDIIVGGLAIFGGQFTTATCVAASTANVNIASPPATIDTVALVLNDKVLLKNQTTASENGVYVYNPAGPTLVRTADCSVAFKLNNTVVLITKGSLNVGKQYIVFATSFASPITVNQIAGNNLFTAASGLITSVGSNNVKTFSIAPNGVLLSMMEQRSDGTVIGRFPGTGSGDPGEIPISELTNPDYVNDQLRTRMNLAILQ